MIFFIRIVILILIIPDIQRNIVLCYATSSLSLPLEKLSIPFPRWLLVVEEAMLRVDQAGRTSGDQGGSGRIKADQGGSTQLQSP